MATAINVSVDETLKKEATDLYADLGLTVQEAIRIFLRRSVRMRGMPFPMNQISQMDMADAEIRHYLTIVDLHFKFLLLKRFSKHINVAKVPVVIT